MTDADEVWRPLGVDGLPEFEGLTDGVPEWLAPSFWAWVRPQYRRVSGARGMAFLNQDLLHQTERVLRINVGFNGADLDAGIRALRGVVERDAIHFRLADFLVASRDRYAQPDELRSLLEEAGSLWTVGTRFGKSGLVRRVEAGVQVAAESAMTTAGRAGERLAEAWTASYGLNPDPSRAYALSIKAVEDASVPVVLPDDPNATLGRVISRLRDVPHHFEVPRERPDVTSQAVLLSMLQLLWHGQGDRHGGLPDASVVISQQEAEAAVLLAVPLVQLFASGAVTVA